MKTAGYEIARSPIKFKKQANCGNNFDLIRDCIKKWVESISSGDSKAVLEWYDTHCPELIALMPKDSQRAEFVAGVLQVVEGWDRIVSHMMDG